MPSVMGIRHAVPPSAGGVMARLAVARLTAAGIDPVPLLRKARITSDQIGDGEVWVAADAQIALLNLAANALQDDLLGFHLAREFDLRQGELLYYVLASSEVLGEALVRVERYSLSPMRVLHCPSCPETRQESVSVMWASHGTRTGIRWSSGSRRSYGPAGI